MATDYADRRRRVINNGAIALTMYGELATGDASFSRDVSRRASARGALLSMPFPALLTMLQAQFPFWPPA